MALSTWPIKPQTRQPEIESRSHNRCALILLFFLYTQRVQVYTTRLWYWFNLEKLFSSGPGTNAPAGSAASAPPAVRSVERAAGLDAADAAPIQGESSIPEDQGTHKVGKRLAETFLGF